MSEGAGARWESLVANARSAASRLRVRSALNPMLWLCGTISIPCLALAAYVAPTLPGIANVLLLIGATPIFATVIGFLFFMVRSPDKLQSEWHGC